MVYFIVRVPIFNTRTKARFALETIHSHKIASTPINTINNTNTQMNAMAPNM
jgi:hypothetical protein